MKKFGKITAALLALVIVLSLFAACGKNNNKEEETTTEGFTLQVNNSEEGITEESTTHPETTTEATTKEENTTKVKPTVKIPSIVTKAPSTTKAPPATNAPTTTKADVTVENQTTVPSTTNPTEPEETKPANVELLLGKWEASFEVDGVAFYVQFEFRQDKTVVTELTRNNYDKMIKGIIDQNTSGITQEELTEAGFANITEYKEALQEYLLEELPYEEMREGFVLAGTWDLDGNTLSVTVEGETETAETRLLEGERTFVLKNASGESTTLTKM